MPGGRLAVALSAVAIFISCSAVAQTAPQPAQPDRKASSYRSGFNDGCMHATTGLERNETRFKTDMLYQAGWQQGFDNCYPHLTINTNGDPNGPLKDIF